MTLTFDQLKNHVGKNVEIRAMYGRLTIAGTLSIVKHPKLMEEILRVSVHSNDGHASIDLKITDSLSIILDEAGNDGEIAWPERIRITIC